MARNEIRPGQFIARLWGGRTSHSSQPEDIRVGLFPATNHHQVGQEPPFQQSDFSNGHDITPSVDREALIERWKNLPRKVNYYKGGTHLDGTPYPGGKTLTIGGEQVMDTFEEDWCRTTVEMMFEGKKGPQTIIERGFGLGIMSEFIYRQMLTRGGTYYIVELNKGVHADAEKWVTAKNRELARTPYPPNFSIILLSPMDADAAIQQFEPRTFDLIFSDTHQIRPEERGINDLLEPAEMASRLKPDGRVSICSFHKKNQTDALDSRQDGLRKRHFREQRLKGVELIPPTDCTYLDGPVTHVAAAVFSDPIYRDAA